MKKRLLLGAMLMGAFAVNAQITDGSPAPEVSGQQVLSVAYPNMTIPKPADEAVVTYGETISLQAYLDQGKTVVMDGSATWCGPCWSFHNSHTLRDLYNAYGPEGSDELRVIFVEADPGTKVGELGGQEGTVNPGNVERGNPQGDWLADVPYPVIDSNVLATSVANGGYGLPAYPSVYVIVPSGVVGQPGTVYNLDRGSLGDMVAAINVARATVSAPAMVGLDYYGRMNAQDIRYCDSEGAIRGYLTSTYGHAITSAQVQLKKDGEVLATQDFNVNISGYDTGLIDFTGFELDGNADYQMVLTKVNGQDPLAADTTADFTSEVFNLTPSASIESSANITIVLHTDEFPSEMGLYLTTYNNAGELVALWSKTFPSNAATYAEKTFTYSVNLNNVQGVTTDTCIGVYLQDAYGDGWDYNQSGPEVEHGVTITSGDGTVLYSHNGTFVGYVQQDATLRHNGVLGNDTFETSSFAVYPNPSTGIFSFSTEEAIDVTVTDLTGKTVHVAKGIENGGSIDLSGLSTGMYIAKINGASGERVEKLIIK